MALEQNNTALDFETMLRRHLSRGGSVVEACLGFDADTANAYLENALNAQARARFDSHLAGCPSCRRHVIELSRLMQLPQPESNRAPAVAAPGIWSHWKAVVAEWGEWLGLATWQQGWATAAAAAAILIGVVSVQLWRQQAQHSENQHAAVQVASGGQNPQTTPNPETSLLAGNDLAGSGETSRLRLNDSNIPRPDVSPIPANTSLTAGQPGNEVAGRNFGLGTLFAPTGNTQFRLDVTTPPSPPQAQPVTATMVSPLLADRQTFGVAAKTVSAETSAPPPPPVADAERRENVVAAQIGPLPSDNPMAKKSKEPKPPKSSSGAFDKAFSFLPTRKTEDARKLEEKEIEPDAPKLLAIRRRDKVFNYQGGFWVDSSYKSEMAWRVTKVVLDSEEYKQLLAAEPLLKEYFAHGQAVVVWKDKIYKVVAK